MKRLKIARLLVLLFALGSGASTSAATMSYTGSGNYDGSVLQMTLANDQTVIGVRVDVIATISDTPPALLVGRCMGLGLVPVEGEEAYYGAEFYCTFRQNDEDAFDFKGLDKLGGIEVQIVGGSGKWQGATGSGTIVRAREKIGTGQFTYEFEITTP